MRFFIFCAALIGSLFMFGCSKSSTTQSVLTPIQAGACTLQTSVLTGFAGSVAKTLNCSHADAIQSSFTTALGNVSFCSQAAKMQAAQKQLQEAALASGKKQGIVGNLVCPLAIDTIVGYASAQIPDAWGCSSSATAAALESTLNVACEAAVPL